ncbi:Tannase/feruloyl esterase [Boeremia exigua]|uniref:Tannase/feruloyl esterase n=1 Tax=Boeremia exigua TaxID=749465 RepID=UPI001E8E8475|nr:Tannase/feruloyl esterase [Boeremia exigua]KAH6644274.1 Tannase/feruloyl esterase [Boeremia exigua]
MALSHGWNNCSAQAIVLPTIFGAEFLSVQASLVQNFSLDPLAGNYQLFRDDDFGKNMSFCNVTLTHTHPNQNDSLISQVWLPIQPEWNGRLRMVGGGGWFAGLEWFSFLTMSVVVADGYATVTTNGGASSEGPDHWGLLSPGNADLLALQNFMYVGLKDAALAAKSVINSFYGQLPRFSYFDGCSQGGRQGLGFAQRYPDIFDGIQGIAPVIHTEFIVAAHFPQQVINEMDQAPHPCEIDALTNLAIDFCDGLDGVLDGIISNEDDCHFDPYTAVGEPLKCSGPSSPSQITKSAASVADAAWNGARRADGAFLWHTMGHQTNLTSEGGLARTICSSNGTCNGEGNSLLTTAIRMFLKDRDFDVSSLSRRDYEQVFRTAFVEFDSMIGTRSPYLYDFKQAGGKMLTFHGLADSIITFRGSRQYYDAVTAVDPDVHEFFRYFEAPGLGHCQGGVGGYPARSFEALVEWVENGVAPVALEAIDIANRTSLLCPYPKRAVFAGAGPDYSSEDFFCA